MVTPTVTLRFRAKNGQEIGRSGGHWFSDVTRRNEGPRTQRDSLNARGIWFTGDLARSLKRASCLVTETNAQAIGWDSRTHYPLYPGQPQS